MQRSRRRKLLRAAKRDPRYLMAVNRATRRSLAAGAIEPTQRNALREAYGQIRAALR
jgi:hypothetical protein